MRSSAAPACLKAGRKVGHGGGRNPRSVPGGKHQGEGEGVGERGWGGRRAEGGGGEGVGKEDEKKALRQGMEGQD